ncbi:MAG: N-acetyl-gamma-glutamyl-phosphate reductase, partial [Gemmataceae bacterium]
MTPIPIAILGGSGYTAVELIKILLRHPGVRIAAVTSREPLPISEHHPSLFGRLDLTCQPMDAKALAALGVKCAFGCLPHSTSMEVIPPLIAAGITVIDLSADYRLKDPAVYETWYKEVHHDTLNLTHAVYGLPELNRDAIRNAQLIANPGCYPQ